MFSRLCALVLILAPRERVSEGLSPLRADSIIRLRAHRSRFFFCGWLNGYSFSSVLFYFSGQAWQKSFQNFSAMNLACSMIGPAAFLSLKGIFSTASRLVFKFARTYGLAEA
ncbi:MAG: hypothetical protein V1913_02070, partial [Fibrobacterota bacterium]